MEAVEKKTDRYYHRRKLYEWSDGIANNFETAMEANDEKTARFYAQAGERIHDLVMQILYGTTCHSIEDQTNMYEKTLGVIQGTLQELTKKIPIEQLQNIKNVFSIDRTLTGTAGVSEEVGLVQYSGEAITPKMKVIEAMERVHVNPDRTYSHMEVLQALLDFYRNDARDLIVELDPNKQLDVEFAGGLYKALAVDQKLFGAYFQDFKGRSGREKRDDSGFHLPTFTHPIEPLLERYSEKFRPEEYKKDRKEEAEFWGWTKKVGAGKTRGTEKRTTASGESPYDVLGVPKNADFATIKRAYRKLRFRYHPDRNPGDPSAEDKSKEVAEAYEELAAKFGKK